MSRGALVQRDIGSVVQRTELQRYKGAWARWRRGALAQRHNSSEANQRRGELAQRHISAEEN